VNISRGVARTQIRKKFIRNEGRNKQAKKLSKPWPGNLQCAFLHQKIDSVDEQGRSGMPVFKQCRKNIPKGR